MKITFLRQHKTPFGGAENYLSRLVTELKHNEVECEVIHSFAPKFLASWIKALFFNMQACLLKGDKFYFSLDRITCPDIYRAGDGVHKVFLQSKKRSFNLLNPVYCYLEKRCFNNARHIIANSNLIKKQIIETYAIAPEKISVIHNGVPPPKPFDKVTCKTKLMDSFGLNPSLPIILYVGSGFERKGVNEMLHLLSKLTTPFHAFIVGKEKRMEEYLKLSASLGIAHSVTFTGAQKDVERFYQGSDIFLFPTRYEPFSNVVLEAMSYKNAVITTAQNGASEVLEERFVMKTPSDETILPFLEKLLNEKLLLHTIQEANGQKAAQMSIEHNVKQTLEVIHAYLH